MSELAIRAENLSKRYRIGPLRQSHGSLKDHLTRGLSRVFRPRAWRAGEPSDQVIYALRDVSFQATQGEVLGIIGPNGAGKSTLLKILSRITEPTAGRAEIFGRVGSLLEVGTGFDPELTGRENVYLNGSILGMKKAEIDRKFDEIVDFSGVAAFIDTPVKRYSSGMYVRLAFAVAAHLEPEILIVDEVLAVGDAAFQRKCMGKMNDVSRKGGRTVIFISHNLPMMSNLCHRVILLHRGSIVVDGTASQAIDRYLAYVSDETTLSLADRTERRGAGQVITSAIELLNSDGSIGQCPIAGQELIIRVHFHCRTQTEFRNSKVAVAIAKDEVNYIIMSTDLVDTKPLVLCGDGWIDFIIPELPLGAGNYYLNSYIEAGGEPQDWVVRASEVTIADGDFYGTGRLISAEEWQGAGVLVKHRCVAGVRESADAALRGE